MRKKFRFIVNKIYAFLSTSYPHFNVRGSDSFIAFLHFSRYTTTTTKVYI